MLREGAALPRLSETGRQPARSLVAALRRRRVPTTPAPLRDPSIREVRLASGTGVRSAGKARAEGACWPRRRLLAVPRPACA